MILAAIGVLAFLPILIYIGVRYQASETAFDSGDSLDLEGSRNYQCQDSDGTRKGNEFADFGGCTGVKRCINDKPLFDSKGQFIKPVRPAYSTGLGLMYPGQYGGKYNFIELFNETFIHFAGYEDIKCPFYIKKDVQPSMTKINDQAAELLSCGFSLESFDREKIFAGKGQYSGIGLNPYESGISRQCAKDQTTGKTNCYFPELEPISDDGTLRETCENGILREYVCDINTGRIHMLKIKCPNGCEGDACRKDETPPAPSPSEVSAGLSDEELYSIVEGAFDG